MMNKFVMVALFAFVAAASCGVIPAAYISPYASTYNAHTINHAVAAPVVAAPSARFVSSPYVAASPYIAASPYSLPYSSPYSFSPYSYPAFF